MDPLGPATVTLAAPANGLEGPFDDSPSMVSPTLVRFEVLEDLKLPSNGCVAPGPDFVGPMNSRATDLPKAETSVGLLKNDGLQGIDWETGEPGEATECLPASPRSPLCFPSDEATDLPALAWTLPPPPLHSQAQMKPLLVYSRCSFHSSKFSAAGDVAADPTAPPRPSLRCPQRMRLLVHILPLLRLVQWWARMSIWRPLLRLRSLLRCPRWRQLLVLRPPL
jgi:hypothetical protein